MKKTKNYHFNRKRAISNVIQRVLTVLLCVFMMFGFLLDSEYALHNPLSKPISVVLTDSSKIPFESGQEVTPGEEFYVFYYYGTIENIVSSMKFPVTSLSSQLGVVYDTSQEIVEMVIKNDNNDVLGVLEVNTTSGAMTFRFDDLLNGGTIDDFYIMFSVKLDENAGSVGETVNLTFPTTTGTVEFPITVVDAEKDPPTINKKGALSEEPTDNGSVEILWTITVTNGNNPHKNTMVKDSWSSTQEYVDGSFKVEGIAVTEGLTVYDDSFQYESTGITPNQVQTITYKTRIKNSSFIKSNLPIAKGNIACKNTAQVFYPNSDKVLSNEAVANYSHPITWITKSSGNVIDYRTGEMEWTITIYNNGLSLSNVSLFDRLSPGVKIKDDIATIKIGNNTEQILTDFKRTYDEDKIYDVKTGKKYNLTYNLGNIGNVAVVTYRTIIENLAEYNAGELLPPDTIFDNTAFITYQIPAGGGLSSIVSSPVVEKSGGYDTGLVGKNGVIEQATHTIKWTITVNKDNESIEGVRLTDLLTSAPALTSIPSTPTYCNHIYNDLIDICQPKYIIDGEEHNFTYSSDLNTTTAFSYSIDGDINESNELIFYLGDIDKEITIVYRSVATDAIIYANNVKGNNCKYENKVTLVTKGNEFSYAIAEVNYKSNVFKKADARSFYNSTEHSYNFADNQLPWLMQVNENKMEMNKIVISDVLCEGTSLVPGSMIIGGKMTWYKLITQADTKPIPEFEDGMSKPYYTYDKATRELFIYLDDITGSDVGTDNAYKQIVFYVKVDVEADIFNNPNRVDYIANTNGVWNIPNTGKLENNHLSGNDAVLEHATYAVPVQHLIKKGNVFKNGDSYSIDYSININRIQQQLPENASIQDVIPVGLRLDVSTIRIYNATVISPDDFTILDKGTNGTFSKGEEVDPLLYQVSTEVNDNGQIVLNIVLPQNSGKKMYVLDFSCDVVDISKAPFVNNAVIEGVDNSGTNQTITKLLLTSAGGGGTLRGVEKTVVNVSKTNAMTTAPVANALFGIYYNGLLIEIKATDANGQIVFNNLNKNYTYTIKELEAAPGYYLSEDATETFIASDITNPVTLDFENTPTVGTVQFIKTDANDVVLQGAEFGIWSNINDIGVEEPISKAISWQNGIVRFSSLVAGNTYYIAEISAPQDYQKSSQVIVAKMGLDGEMEKLWLSGDDNTAITTFSNDLVPVSLVVNKIVTGNMRESTKEFSFTLNVNANTRLLSGTVLHGSIVNGAETISNVEVIVGKAFSFTLKHGESLIINGLKAGTECIVTEDDYRSERYTTSYVITQNGIVQPSQSGRSATIITTKGDNIETFTNNADVAVPTGIEIDIWPYALIVLISTIGSIIIISKKRKDYRSEEL